MAVKEPDRSGGEALIGLAILFIVLRWVIKTLLEQADRTKTG